MSKFGTACKTWVAKTHAECVDALQLDGHRTFRQSAAAKKKAAQSGACTDATERRVFELPRPVAKKKKQQQTKQQKKTNNTAVESKTVTLEAKANDERHALLRKLFPRVPRPGPNDWLASVAERGQTLRSFERMALKARPHSTYRTIYVFPLGEFGSSSSSTSSASESKETTTTSSSSSINITPALEDVKRFADAFFGPVCAVELLPGRTLAQQQQQAKKAMRISSRTNAHTQRIQLLTTDILRLLDTAKLGRVKRKQLVSVALCSDDVYPGEDYNFVYGIARPADGVGCWSFARLSPLFHLSSAEQKALSAAQLRRARLHFLKRAVAVFCHEVGHLFGLKHCPYYKCLMTGAMHEQEMDNQPLHLCPICLRKLHSTFAFPDLIARYRRMYDACVAIELHDEAAWFKQRLALLDAPVTTTTTTTTATTTAAAAKKESKQ
jgi:archaemetzincin